MENKGRVKTNRIFDNFASNNKTQQVNTNIVQAVKNCYKLKIDSIDFRGGFYSFWSYEDTPTRHFGLL